MYLLALKTVTMVGLLGRFTCAKTFAQFCNDADCNDCGISVSVNNPGCLMEFGRVAVKFHDVNLESVNLVSSPDPTCGCQNHCYEHVVASVNTGPGCFPLTGPAAQSFRFVGEQICDPDNC